jgi:hypothetical protein
MFKAVEEDIINKETSSLILKYLICNLCKLIVREPTICTKCGYLLCLNCLNSYTDKNNGKSPCKCNVDYMKSTFIKNSIKKLKFKCHENCGEENINYDDLEKHYEIDCIKIPFNEMYSNLLNEYEKMKNKIEEIKTSNESSNIVFTSRHLHCLTLCLTNKNWLCDKCRINYSKNDKSYYCSVCDFDLCKTCLNQLEK